MFESLSEKLGDVFGKLRRRGTLTEDEVRAALREVRVALLEADVALPVAKELISRVNERAVGQEVLRSVTPGQQVIKIVHDSLVELLGGDPEAEEGGVEIGGPTLDIRQEPPAAVLMLGLQGSGKTTTTAKIGKRLTEHDRKRVLMASLDTQRPAAQDQLRILGEQVGVDTLPVISGQKPVDIAKRAMKSAKAEGYDIVLLDTAGRLSIDEGLMAELAQIRDAAKPAESLLVADAMTGQDAVTTAQRFNEEIGVSGIVLTRMDGDARGGAALSMRQVTGCPVRLIGTGEKTDALERFHPDRIANRILGMGDVVSLVEKAAETIDREEAEKMAEKLQKGGFNLDDFAGQIKQMRKMGGMSGMMGMLPGALKAKAQMAEGQMDDKTLMRQEAIISSMTRKERHDPNLLNASRRRRIATGSGTSVQDVNRLMKQYQQMQQVMKRMRKMGSGGMMNQLGSLFGGGAAPSEAEQAAMLQNLGASGGGMPGLPGGGGMPPGMGGMPAPAGRGSSATKRKNKGRKKRKR